jgi:hypothetical protein
MFRSELRGRPGSGFGRARIGLVSAARPADVLALVGFNGTGNGYGIPELLSAVLRSWEDRFGAALIEVGFDHIRMLVQRPPRTVPDAQAVAAELYVMCNEFWPSGEPGVAVYDVREIAEHTLDISIWSMWWDLPDWNGTISLGIGQIVADEAADQPDWATRSSRDRPLVTLANCTLITGRSWLATEDRRR